MKNTRRMGASTAWLLLITAAALFAVVGIVLDLDVRTVHPFITALYGGCALWMLLLFGRSVLYGAASVQTFHIGVSLSLAVFFAALSVWNGHFPLVLTLILLPVGAVLFTLAVFSHRRRNAFLYMVSVAVGAAMLAVLLGFSGVLPFCRPQKFFFVIYIGMMGVVFGRLLTAKIKGVRDLLYAAARLAFLLLFGGCALFGGHLSLFRNTLISAAGLLGTIVLFFGNWKWCKKVQVYCIAVLAFAATVLKVGLMTGVLERKTPESNLQYVSKNAEFIFGSVSFMLVIGAVSLLISVLSTRIRFDESRFGSKGCGGVLRSLLSAPACVVCMALLLFGGYLDFDAYFLLCTAVGLVVLILLIWRGLLLPLNVFAIASLGGMMFVWTTVLSYESVVADGTGMQILMLSCFFILLIPTLPGALILTLRRCGNIYKCRKALHSFLCSVCFNVCMALISFGGNASGLAKMAICAGMIGMILFAVYAVFEKRRMREI